MSSMHQPASTAEVLSQYGIDPILHAIDFEDVALTREGARLVHLGAKAVMRQYMPAADCDSLTASQAVALFVDKLFWEEHSGGLIMCTDMADKSVCLPIPRRHWGLKDTGVLSQ
ncbi:hypothetical protein [Pseudodesulfovibrio sediminis]|uniref:Uncharacterized protein n=1 Tax=Pseudodesulfovibrio sediminis TaxID=2810563 RepID=A0ABN6EX21_9BACT|nr:hypothetical protein [Pseudodesulfovibrio sediminis]BCS90063.1 hypothetical protein PSDVSF_33050 [Pseudodesulfovibrio sediminis]